MQFPIWKPTVGSVKDAAMHTSLPWVAGCLICQKNMLRTSSDQIREAFADKHSLPRKGVLHSLGDSADGSGMLCVQAHLL